MSRSLSLVWILFYLFQVGSSNIILYEPHFPVWGRNYFVNWTTSQMMVYPEQNVTIFDEYKFFVSEINFEDAASTNFFIGAKNALYEMAENLTIVRTYNWEATQTNVDSCKSQSIDDSFACHNHIRVYKKLPYNDGTDRLFVCGTDAYSPKCRTLKIVDINDTNGASTPNSTNNVGIISVHPAVPALWTFQDDPNKLLATGFYHANQWSDFDFARYNASFDGSTNQVNIETSVDRSIQSGNDFHINEPYHPLKLYHAILGGNEDYNMYLFFFRERDFGADDTTPVPVRSRVIRICENDALYLSSQKRFFGSLVKAEIVCAKYPLGTAESFGAQIYYYTGLRDTFLTTSPSRWYGNTKVWHELLYGIFTGEQYSPNGTAICVYYAGIQNLNDVGVFLDGDSNTKGLFEVFNQNTFSNENSQVQTSYLRCSAANGRVDVARDRIKANTPIQQYRGLRLPILELTGEVLTKIAVDRVCVVTVNNSNSCLMQDVLFVGTDRGRILKIVFTTDPYVYPANPGITLDGLTYTPVIAQEWELADSNSIEQLHIRNESNVRYIYTTTYSRIYKFPISDCSRHGNCEDCIGSRDPYCVWNSNNNMCEDNTYGGDSSGSFAVNQNHHQNVHNNNWTVCQGLPECSLNVIGASHNGFQVTGADTCNNTATLNLMVTPHFCSGSDLSFTLDTNSPSQTVSNSSILGQRLYKVVCNATGSNGVSSYIFFAQTGSGAPAVPTSNEIIGKSLNSTHIQVVVNLDGCSLRSNPNDYSICVQFSGSISQTICQNYTDINTFVAGEFQKCESVSYTVTITNSMGSATSATYSATPLTSAPNIPSNVETTQIMTTSLVVQWNPPAISNNYCNIIGYSIYVGDTKRTDCLASSNNSYTLEGLYPFTSYAIDVAACSSGGESSHISTNPKTGCSPPFRVRNLAKSSDSDTNSLQFSWMAPSYHNGTDLQYYVMQECYNRTTITVDEDQILTSQSSHSISNLAPNTLCCITVISSASCNSIQYNSSESQICGFTVDDIPGPVENLIATPSSPNSIFISWSVPLNYSAPGLIYTISITKTDKSNLLTFEVINQLHFHIYSLEENTDYIISVTARNDIGEGESIEITNTTLPNFPDAPTNVNLNLNGCQLTVTWEDVNKVENSVDMYTAFVRCNKLVQNLTVSIMSAAFDICSEGPLGLTWCSAQVYSENDVGTSELSELSYAVYPLVKPSRPNCYKTEDVGTAVEISFTITTPYALDQLYVRHKLKSVYEPNPPFINNLFSDLSNNSFRLTSLVRNTDYTFELKLCDQNPNNNLCSDPCSLSFTASMVPPGPPIDVKVTRVTNSSIEIIWLPPPNENASIIEYFVSLTGLGNGTVVNSTTKLNYTFEDLSPETEYTIALYVRETVTNLTSPYTMPLSVKTQVGIPTIVSNLGGQYYKDINELAIYWLPPDKRNGIIRNYTFVWSTIIDNCVEIYGQATNNIDIIAENGTYQRRYRNVSNANIRRIYLCMAASTSEFMSEWSTALISENGFITAGLGSPESEGTNIALYVVVVLAIIAITAAIIMMVILAFICYVRHKEGSCSNTTNANGTIEEADTPRKSNKSRQSPKRMESTRSEAPMIP